LNVAKYIIALVASAVLFGCVRHEVQLPPDVLSKDEMVPILVDIQLVEGSRSGKLVLGDTNKLPDYYARVYEKHHITAQEFRKSFDWYSKNPAEAKKVFEKVIEELSILESEIKMKNKEAHEKQQKELYNDE